MAGSRRLWFAAAMAFGGAWACAGAPDPQSVTFRVVTVDAAVSPGPVRVDPRIPEELRRRLERIVLPYKRYDLLKNMAQAATQDKPAVFDLAHKDWKLRITPQVVTATRVKLETHIYEPDPKKPGKVKTVNRRRWHVGYNRSFLFHFPKTRDAALLMGVAARKAR